MLTLRGVRPNPLGCGSPQGFKNERTTTLDSRPSSPLRLPSRFDGASRESYPMSPMSPASGCPPDPDGTRPAASGHKWFPTTHWSVVLAAGRNSASGASQEGQAALEKLCTTYWYPLYAYVRRRGYAPHDAQDLTQAFFALLLERNYLETVEQDKGKFRSFLLAMLNHFLSHERERASAAKRGGGHTFIPLEADTAENLFQLDRAGGTPDEAFDKNWARTVLERAFARVRGEFANSGKAGLFEQLQNFLVEGTEPKEYTVVAAGLGMTPNAMAVAVHRLRQRYRDAVRFEVADTVAETAEIEGEMRYLFAALSR